MKLVICSLLAASSLAATSAEAQVTFYDAFFNGYARQDDETTHPVPDQYYFSTRIFCTGADDIGGAQVYIPNSQVPLTLGRQSPTVWQSFSPSYPDETSILAAYPIGPYIYEICCGNEGDQQAEINRQVAIFPPPAVYTEGTYTALQGFDSTQDFTVHFSSFDLQQGGNVAITYLSIYSLANSQFLYSTYADQPVTSLVIPANTIAPDTAIAVYVTHSSRLQRFNAGFGSAISILSFDLSTYAEAFTASGAPPCPADFNQDGGVDGADVEAFFASWENGLPEADVNQDGGIDGTDVDTFFLAWEAGGCG